MNGLRLRTWFPRWMQPLRDSLTRAELQIADVALQDATLLRNLSPAELAAYPQQLTTKVLGKEPRVWLTGALAAFSEAVRRAYDYLPHQLQLTAATILVDGKLVEMATGEGKTLTAACAAMLQCWRGRRVHIMTQNSYLAERDQQTLLPLYKQFGLTSTALREQESPDKRADAYRCQIVHGSGSEFGFDYLRQQNSRRRQREKHLGANALDSLAASSRGSSLIDHDFAIVDEVDSILIDEASLPLVLSEPVQAQSDANTVDEAQQLAAALTNNKDYVCLLNERRVVLTALGEQKIKEHFAKLMGERLQRPWAIYVQQALQAQHVYRRDVDYVVAQGKVQIVDQQTGRVFPDRTWQEGLHQAIEAKEQVKITAENLSVARIYRQKFMGVYRGICGLTGTLAGVEREFENRLGLRTVTIPLRIPSRRVDLPDRFFVDKAAKFQAAVVEITRIHQQRRPILVGTRTIETSYELSKMLAAQGLAHEVLSGVQDRDEAEIIAQAGQPRAITIATNLAGRGTDIHVPAELDELGGLHVLALERCESRRVDLQLAGRTARQGNAGSAQFLVSADDILLQMHGQSLAKKMRNGVHREGELQNDFSATVYALQCQAEAEFKSHRDRILTPNQ